MGGYWEPLASEDPIPGEPSLVDDLAGTLADVAMRMDDQLSTLEQINAGDVWDSDAAAKFVEIQGELTPDLRLAKERYDAVAAALDEYAPELRAAQEEAELARVEGRAAQDEIDEAQGEVARKESYEEDEAQRVADHNEANPDDTPMEPEPFAGSPDPEGALEDAQRRLEQARGALEAAVERRDSAAIICADKIYDARKDDLEDPSGWGAAWNSVTGWASDRWDDVTDAWDAASDALARLGNALLDFGLEALKYLGIRLAQVLCLVLEVITAPLMVPLGLFQVTLALINGETDLGDLGRHFINSRATTTGQLLGLAGGADLTYNDEYGVWIAQGAGDIDLGPVSIPTHGEAATAYGSAFVTEDVPEPGHEAEWQGRIAHEAVHAGQWAQYGGGFIYVAAYLEDFKNNGYEYGRDMDFEEPAYEEQGRVEQEHGAHP